MKVRISTEGRSIVVDMEREKAETVFNLLQLSLKIQEEKKMFNKFPYIEGQPAEIFHDGKWNKGKIFAGYRFRDGVVTVLTEDGQKIWCGEARKELYRPA